jgi:hypothetical protein
MTTTIKQQQQQRRVNPKQRPELLLYSWYESIKWTHNKEVESVCFNSETIQLSCIKFGADDRRQILFRMHRSVITAIEVQPYFHTKQAISGASNKLSYFSLHGCKTWHVTP